MTGIKYGRIKGGDGRLIGYATYENEYGQKVELFNNENGLAVRRDGEWKVKPTETEVMIWTHIAGWFGMDATLRGLAK